MINASGLCPEDRAGLIPDPIADSESLVVKVRKMPSRTAIGRRLLDLGSVGGLLDCNIRPEAVY